MSLELASAYRTLRPQALRRLARYLYPHGASAEDVLHDVCIEVLERYDTSIPVGHLIVRLLRFRACNELTRLRGMALTTVREYPVERSFERWLEAREVAKKAQKILTAEELSLMMREWKRQPPSATAIKIRLAKRKLQSSLGTPSHASNARPPIHAKHCA